MRIGKLNQPSLANLHAGGWSLISDYLISNYSATEKLVILGDAIADATGKAVTAYGTAAVDTSQSKFAQIGSSIFFDGNSDYLSLADSADWAFGSGDWTIDFWFKLNANQTCNFVSQHTHPYGLFTINYSSNSIMVYSTEPTVGTVEFMYACAFTYDTNWHHIACVRSGDNLYFFIDGISRTLTTYTSISGKTLTDFNEAFCIGYNSKDSNGYVNGWMSGIRVRKAATWTSDFTTPVYDDYGGARTKLKFSGLDGDTDQEYRLVALCINGYNGASANWIYLNNDSTAGHYGYQGIQGVNSTPAAFGGTDAGIFLNATSITNLGYSLLGECVIKAKSGVVRTALVSSANNINGTTVGQVYRMGFSWNNSADNLTSITLAASQANGLGVGTHVFLFKRNLLGSVATTGIKTGTLNVPGTLSVGAMCKIAQTTLTSGQTSVTFSGLDGNTDVLYEVRARVVNAYNGTAEFNLLANNDSASNYGYQYVNGDNTTVAASRSVAAKFYGGGGGYASALNALAMSRILIYAKSGYVRTALCEHFTISGTTISLLYVYGQSWNNTADNITSLVVSSNRSSAFGVGTVIELWALRKKL